MIKEIKLPEVSESINAGTVIKVLVNTGDMLEEDQPMIELETEKAMFEVPSTGKGKIVEILVKEGDTIKVGSVILKIDDGIGETELKPAAEKPAAEKPKEDSKINKKKIKESVPEKAEPSVAQETEIKPEENISKPEEKISKPEENLQESLESN